jgi:hypothetical protein
LDYVITVLEATGFGEWFAELFRSDVAKMTLAFTIAAQMHRRWVKKDVTEQFGKLEGAINNVARNLSQDFAVHNSRLEKIENGLANLDNRIRVVETIQVEHHSVPIKQ